MLQVVRMQNLRNIWPMPGVGWSGLVCAPASIFTLSVRMGNSRQPKTGAHPARGADEAL